MAFILAADPRWSFVDCTYGLDIAFSSGMITCGWNMMMLCFIILVSALGFAWIVHIF